ncbi:hypothetical protein QCM77_04225 [Bradyrhizobium sp. SSUT18]|nr:hypothetical protein [Bradyrhizobium sp. SSUT18]
MARLLLLRCSDTNWQGHAKEQGKRCSLSLEPVRIALRAKTGVSASESAYTKRAGLPIGFATMVRRKRAMFAPQEFECDTRMSNPC